MPLKKLWTLANLHGWACPAGLRVFYALSPTGKYVRVVLMGLSSDVVQLLPPAWGRKANRARLDEMARKLLAEDSAAVAHGYGEFKDGIKAAVRRKLEV